MVKKDTDISVPKGEGHLLLHACCAPCSGAIIEELLREGIRPVVFYSNSNIVPLREYEIRKEECRRYCVANGLEFVDDDYDHLSWKCIATGLEDEPERGKRCLECFRYRLSRAAKYAHGHSLGYLATTLASSRWKDLSQVNEAGESACAPYPDLVWWPRNWRKGGLQERRSQIIREQNFYNQLYCGCEFSMARLEKGKDSQSEKPRD